jgi:ArsR family transcriptional regulator
LSYHMKVLTECGIVAGRKVGTWMHYSLNQDKLDSLQAFLGAINTSKENCLCKVQPGQESHRT